MSRRHYRSLLTNNQRYHGIKYYQGRREEVRAGGDTLKLEASNPKKSKLKSKKKFPFCLNSEKDP